MITMRRLAAAAALLFVFAMPNTEPAPGNVTIPLSEYDAMRKSSESASATVVDTLTLGGTFAAKSLTVTMTGRSVGARTATGVITDAPDLTLSGCRGEAMLLRSGGGAYQILALAPSFTLRCDARLAGSDRLQLSLDDAVLAVRSAVSDGELVTGDEGQDARTYTLVRQVAGGDDETLATTATGHYLITLLPDTTRFRYVIQVHNPNRNTAPLPLRLVSGEHLQQIDSAAPYEPNGGSYVFAMPPGDSTITLSGELQGTSFAPPVEASLQYVVLESHPLLRPAVQSQPKRVSTGETGIHAQYRGALAFEIGPRERIAWSVTRLEAMRAISYAVRTAAHTLFIPADGPVLGETALELDNQGAPELVLPPHPQPTFVSLQNEPVLMTRNAAGELTVPLSAGPQHVVVQHQQRIGGLPLVFARLELPHVPVPATNTTLALRYPAEWMPLWQSFGTRTLTWRPEGGALALFVLFAVWIERVLAFLAMRRGRVAAALLLAFAAVLVPIVTWIVAGGFAALTVVWIVGNREKIVVASLALAVVLIAALLYVFGQNASVLHERTVVATDTSAVPVGAMPPPAARAAAAAAYQGLPARFELPDGVRFASFHEQMLAPDRPQTVSLVLLSMTVVTWTAVAMAIAAAALLWRERAALEGSLRARLAEAMPAAPAPA
jgi:hypothetical protein